MSELRERALRRLMPDEGDRGFLAGLRRVTIRTVADALDDRVPGLAAEMAFFTVLSLPPLLLAVLGSVGFVVGGLPEPEIADLEARLLDGLSAVLARETIDDVLAAPIGELLRNGRSDVLSIGVILTLWSASRATNVVLRTLVIAYDQEDRRPVWKRRGLAFVLTLAGIILAVAVIPLLAVGPGLATDLLAAVGLDPGLSRFWPVAYWGGVGVVVLAALTWLYHVAPGWNTPWRRDFPGAVLALALWLLAGLGLRYYTTTFAGFTAQDAFGGLAAPLVLLLWVYLSAMAVLLGAELNAEIEKLWPAGGAQDHADVRRTVHRRGGIDP